MMNVTISPPQRLQIECNRWPLAVYRELATHLRQVEGVETELIPSESRVFSYQESQVGGLWIGYPENADPLTVQRIEKILAYYSQRYGVYQSQVV